MWFAAAVLILDKSHQPVIRPIFHHVIQLMTHLGDTWVSIRQKLPYICQHEELHDALPSASALWMNLTTIFKQSYWTKKQDFVRVSLHENVCCVRNYFILVPDVCDEQETMWHVAAATRRSKQHEKSICTAEINAENGGWFWLQSSIYS